jgi:solute:Na+ symporter, SSS family
MGVMDGVILLLYVLVICLIWLIWKNEFFRSFFKSSSRISWMVGSVSLFMYQMSPNALTLNAEVLRTQGLKGFWIFFSQWMAVGFIPFVFAPLWNGLQLYTDNEFILKRFSGVGAKILFYFRAGFLGFIITPIIVSFQVLVFSSFLEQYWSISYAWALTVCSIFILLSSLKNSLGINLRTDFFHGVLYVSVLVLIFGMLINKAGSPFAAVKLLEQSNSGITELFPATGDQKSWNALFVLFGIQWWSISLFDGGGVEMQRFNSAQTPVKAIYLAAGGILLSVVFSLFNLIIAVLAASISTDGAGIFTTIRNITPDSIRMLITLGIWAAFITTAESMVNWGSSFIVVPSISYFGWKDGGRKALVGSMIFVVSLTTIAVIFAWYNRSLSTLFFWFLSFSAGVAPVFFLRWFWYRINAWAQLSAMLGAAIYTVLYDRLEPVFAMHLRYDLLDPFYWKVIIMTALNMLTWITVMYLTPADDPEKISIFRSNIPSKQWLLKRVGWSLFFSVLVVSVYVMLLMSLFGQ